MKRSKKMFNRFTSMLHNAVEALAPEMSLLEQFRYHWKCITQYFLDSTDERISVESTSIPHHLEQMIEVLRQEEQENGIANAGASMEFMLQHKILETMQTLGKADCPPGMKQQVLIFFTKLLGKLRQQLLPHVNVHKPVNKLVRCCGQVKAAPTETEEVQFLLQVSSKLKQDSYLVNFFLEKPSSRENSTSPPLSPGMLERNNIKPEYSLVDALLALTCSEDSRVAIKACEGLILCTSIPEDHAARVIVLYTAFCERMADQLSKLFKGLPAVIDPADMNQLSATWGFDHEDPGMSLFPGKRQMIAFFSWLDYVNQLSVEAHPMVAKALALAIRERFIQTAIEPGLSQASEPCAITVTAVLTRCLKLVTSSTLAQEFADILLGMDTEAEIKEHQSPHKLRRLLIHRINHLSDQLAIETLRLFQALLHLSYQPILNTLVTRNFQTRQYLDFEKYKRSLIASKSRTSSTISLGRKQNNKILNSSASPTKTVNNPMDPNISPIKKAEMDAGKTSESDKEISDNNSSTSSNADKKDLTTESNKSETSSNSDISNVSFYDGYNSSLFNKKRVEKTVNGFLLILPDSLRTSEINGETGYDSYLRDAHKQCEQRSIQTFSYDWPDISKLNDSSEDSEGSFYEGAFLNTILQRLHKILDQPYEINLEITAIISLLSQFQHPFLHEFLLDASNVVKDGVQTPHKILVKVCEDMKVRAGKFPSLVIDLKRTRKSLSSAKSNQQEVTDNVFLEGIITFEEFCKELAAIAFVSATMQTSR